MGGSTYIIPGMNFTCNGRISSWMAGGVTHFSSRGDPKLQIWRESSPSSSTYTLAASISLLNCNGRRIVVTSTNLYVCSFNGVGIAVQQGDIIGIYLTRTQPQHNQFRVFFSKSITSLQTIHAYGGNITSFSLNSPGSRSEEMAVPLITLNVISDGML